MNGHLQFSEKKNKRDLSDIKGGTSTPRSGPSEKIINKINRAVNERRTFYSFEFFPPKTEAGVMNLYNRIDRMVAKYEPMFVDVTWGAGGSTAKLTLEISSNVQNYCATDVLMHLTCTNMPRDSVKDALDKAKEAGIRNILALRGDPPHGQDTWEKCDKGFEHALDLVKFIREEYGEYFGIAVAGYPEGHISSPNLEEDIKHLKLKVDAGADFIMTQLFYDVDLYIDFVKRCRQAEITVPILPGLMPINSYNAFKRMIAYTKATVPKEIIAAIEPIKNNDAMVKAFGIELAKKMSQKILRTGLTPGLHFYTLNLEKSVTKILGGLGLARLPSKGVRPLPWKQSCATRRRNEDVRPIFWANRPYSYLSRTISWDEFPNGRWGNSTSPAYGELYDYHLMGLKSSSVRDRLRMWGGEVQSEQDVFDKFADYIEGKIARLPWCETGIMLETLPLKQRLMAINKTGFLTINSQPRVNGARSDDEVVGWGDPDGYVYQKAYIEFFASPERIKSLKALASRKEYKTLSYHAVNAKGDQFSNYTDKNAVNAVTWGVFPGREVLQPTVVDMDSFRVWKDEAFALWISQWRSIYSSGSASWEIIQKIHDTYGSPITPALFL
uniref:methylenetetrahydrofolate reductase (NADH) n=1 Tax=Lotharella globosa TaxID=91324 RepID=A0A7S3Z0N0_9EUKA